MTMSTLDAENREVVRTALERDCARGDMTLAPSSYAEDFVDHVGRLEYRGLEGVRRSTALYRALLDDLAFNVVDQVAEGDRVATRFLVTGSNRGRRVRLEASRSAACATGASSRTGPDSTASSSSGSSVCVAA
jgi:predicted ester cyclase